MDSSDEDILSDATDTLDSIDSLLKSMGEDSSEESSEESADNFKFYKKHVLEQLDTHGKAISELDQHLDERLRERREKVQEKIVRIHDRLDQIDQKHQDENKVIRSDHKDVEIRVTKTSAKVAIITSIVMAIITGGIGYFWSKSTSQERPRRPVPDTTIKRSDAPKDTPAPPEKVVIEPVACLPKSRMGGRA